MKKNPSASIIFFASIICVCSFDVSAQCFNAPYGQKPATTQTILVCNGTYQTMSEGCYNGEYTKLNVIEGAMYSFKSSEPSDKITISNEEGTTSYIFGTGTVGWTASLTGVVRFYTHNTKGGCGADNNKKRREVSCTPRSLGGGAFYTTGVPCSPLPGNPVVTTITSSTATISWTLVSGLNEAYEIEIRSNGAAPGTTLEGLVRKWTTPAGVNSLLVTNLDRGTGYFVYVRTKCLTGGYTPYTSTTFWTLY